MTHPNHQTNGASLEDCHTNFFALTDLCGIKWRKLVWSEGGGGGSTGAVDPLEDPVLRSYSQCIANDILCVWRRTSAAHAASNPYDLGMLAPPPPSQAHPPLSLAAAKELWIFWYGEEPDLSELVAPELISPDGEQGSWESGLSYECRSLLFKALHNLIERCLLSRDFVRLGKWFVQPYDGPKKNMGASTTHLSFSFAFFVHGESTVCASVDVRQHPPVRRLTKSHLLQAQTSTNGLQVILAPFSLSGSLTGQSFKTPDAASRILEDWGHFYPMEKFSVLDGDYPGVPPAVEVIVGGVKMRYPSCYVLVTDMDENVNQPPAGLLTVAGVNQKPPPNIDCSGPPAGVQTPPPSPVAISSKVPQSGPLTVSVEHTASMQRPATVATILPERVWQECVLGGPPSAGQSHDGQWDFVDPTKRTSCSCSKCRKYLGPSKSCSSKGGMSSKPGKGARGRVPFHRRSPVPLSQDRYQQQQQGSCTPQGGPPSYPRTQESLTVPSVGSPPSAAPSPLPNPHSQPASIPPGDQAMPTLSPQPAAQPSTPADKPENTPGEAPKSAGSPGSPQAPASSSGAGQGQGQEQRTPDDKAATATTPTSQPVHSALKRPVLTSKEYENAVLEEEQTLDLLYDYSTLDAWLNHPVKKFKPDSKENKIQKMGRMGDIYSLYGSTPNGIQAPNDTGTLNGNANAQQMFIKQEIKQEPGTNCMMENEACLASTPIPGGMKRPGDPYEFEEEGANSVNMDGFKRGAVPVKEEAKEIKKCPAGNLFTSEGLQPSYRDLDQIFDNSDDTSSDEALQVQTPPGSNKSMGANEDSKRMSSGHGGSGTNNSILRQEELSKMFPTPPSLEHNPVASPCGQLDVPTVDMCELGIVRIKQESYPNLGSPDEEKIEDWSFVFRPPLICKMVGSSKYAPLTNLPSQNLPPVVLPSHCVYKPSWVTHSEKPAREVQLATAPNGLNSRPGSVASNPHNTHSSAPFPPSPLHTTFRPPPPPYELSSPATSTASSYLNKNLNSVEPVATPSVARAPEASALLVNILLADTALNIFRDHNFDSCTLCVCNAGPKVVGNIRGADAGIYLAAMQPAVQPPPSNAAPTSPFLGMGLPNSYGMLSPPHHQQMALSDEDPIRCSCGFSAVVNRKLSHRSGLFYEDELEITGIAEDPSERKKGSLFTYLLSTSTTKMDPAIEREQVDTIPQTVLELVREQCVMLQSTSNSLHRAARYHRNHASPPPYATTVNVLEFTDSNEVTSVALEQGRQANMDSASLTMCKIEELQHRTHGKTANALCIHKWPFLRASGPQCNQDIVRVMKSLQPLLQEAIQKKCTTRLWEAPYTVKGPLTWRQFHRLAGRGTDDRCEPQPIPSLIVGHDKDWLSLSPYALQHWDRLLLEPYSFARDVAYIVVAPDNDAILPRVRTFFKELSTAYEVCRLGRHSPITKVLRDGILRVGKNAKTKLANEPVEDWFTMLGESDTTDMIKLYAQACKHHLAPHLLQVPMDKTLLDPPETTDKPAIERPTPSPMPPPSTPDNTPNTSDKAPSTPKTDQDGGDSSRDPLPPLSTLSETTHDDDDQIAPSIVVYLVEPFTMGTDHADLQRLACVALLRCFQSVLNAVPDHIRTNISVQIISQESIVELGRARDRNRQSDHMRALALSIFSQCRRLLVHSSNVKSLTGFGTAAMADLFLKNKDEKNRAPYKLYTPPYVLAPLKERAESAESFGQSSSEQCSVLYVSYCLSEDQSLILAVATDERGEICESVTINIDVPNRSRRKKASARRIGLQKLMDFILGVMSQTVQPWRLVVGRIGRIGHGELKGWSWLLSRKSLLKASKHLKEICRQCELMYPANVPCIMSACLVSLEPDSTLRLMPDQFTPDERFSQASVNSQLSTPHDVTCTHILVFPTSATTQSSQTAFQETHINGPDLGDDELLTALNDDMPEGIDGMNDFNDIFSVWPESGPGGGPSPIGSPRREESRPGSPGCGLGGTGRQSPFPCGAAGSRGGEPTEEVGTLLQQPLALGYLVSTAPTGRMPRWFWASCPHLEGVCPAFLKNALHLHSPAIQQSSDDLLQQAAVTSHPLDSQYTTDVLRFVLEGYNALSWLALDSNTQDRLSCLPVHIQVLTQLYHMTATLL